MKLESSAFQYGDQLPIDYTCQGRNINPPLAWTMIPDKTKSFVLIVDDPDAPTEQPWVHWILFNLPANMRSLQDDVDVASLREVRSGMTTEGSKKFQGACPPHGHGIHRYYFRLYALDTTLDIPDGARRDEVEKAMKAHVIATAELMGTYIRDKR